MIYVFCADLLCQASLNILGNIAVLFSLLCLCAYNFGSAISFVDCGILSIIDECSNISKHILCLHCKLHS